MIRHSVLARHSCQYRALHHISKKTGTHLGEVIRPDFITSIHPLDLTLPCLPSVLGLLNESLVE